MVLLGLGVGIAVLAVVWIVVKKGSEPRRLTVDDLDIDRAANELIKQYGDEAPIHAAMMADKMLEVGDLDGQATWKRIIAAIDELLEAGDLDGQAVWKRILAAVDELQSRERPEGEKLH